MHYHCILFLAANPLGMERLALDSEVRAIEDELVLRDKRDRFRLVTRSCVRAEDVVGELRKHKPSILHIGGHGWVARDSPLLVAAPDPDHDDLPDQLGRSGFEFARLLALARARLRLVVLSACYSEKLADSLLPHVDAVMGMAGPVTDDAARRFAVALYGGIAADESFTAVHRRGCVALGRHGPSGRSGPQFLVRAGVDVDSSVLTDDRAPSTTVDALVDSMTLQASSEDLRPLAHFIGECVARRDSQTLSRFHTRARQLRQQAEAGSWHRGFADALTAYLDGYFAEHEPAIQRDKMASEVVEHELWREILAALSGQSLNQVMIGDWISKRAPGVASSKSMISTALEDLRVRELVESTPGKSDRREKIHSLTMRGRQLLTHPVVVSAFESLRSGPGRLGGGASPGPFVDDSGEHERVPRQRASKESSDPPPTS